MNRTLPAVAVAVDLAVLTIRGDRLHVLLVERAKPPYRGSLALPGGFFEPHSDQDLEQAAARELAEETGLVAGRLHLEQLGAYSALDRDPRGRVVSVAYVGLGPRLPEPDAGGDAARARWIPVDPAAGVTEPLAFDHAQILADGLAHVQRTIEHTSLAAAFCPDEFTISDLRQVYEIVWGTSLDVANFRRKVLSIDGFLVATDQTRVDGGRPARLYRRGPAKRLSSPILRPAVRSA